MEENVLEFIFSQSILIPVITGIIKFRQIRKEYFPLWLLLILGSINEWVVYQFFSDKSSTVTTHIFNLVDTILIFWLLYLWGDILRTKRWFILLICIITVAWTTEYIILGGLNSFSPFFMISAPILIVFAATSQMNWIVVNIKSNMLVNPKFIICIAVIIFYSYRVLVEIFYFYEASPEDKSYLFKLYGYVNIITNVLIGFAFLCIPKRQKFIQL